ncbi:hypothetical protein D3C77_615990 [compost metagenome]
MTSRPRRRVCAAFWNWVRPPMEEATTSSSSVTMWNSAALRLPLPGSRALMPSSYCSLVAGLRSKPKLASGPE